MAVMCVHQTPTLIHDSVLSSTTRRVSLFLAVDTTLELIPLHQ